MLLRKRAWDIVREEYPTLQENDSLSVAVRKLNSCVGHACGCLCALVFDDEGHLKGSISIWDTMRFMEDKLTQRSAMRGGEDGYDRVFHNACKLAGSTKVRDLMDREMTTLSPDDSLITILDKVVKKGRSYAVVKDASKVIGVIMISDIFNEISTDMLRMEGKKA
ncbi:MAG: CBS domain-containing protein [Pseudomonadota bacterium]